MNKKYSLLLLLPLLLVPMVALTPSAANGVRACDDNHSCVVTYKNGTQSVQLSSAKWKCMNNILHGVIEKTAEHGVTISTNFTMVIEGLGLAVCLTHS